MTLLSLYLDVICIWRFFSNSQVDLLSHLSSSWYFSILSIKIIFSVLIFFYLNLKNFKSNGLFCHNLFFFIFILFSNIIYIFLFYIWVCFFFNFILKSDHKFIWSISFIGNIEFGVILFLLGQVEKWVSFRLFFIIKKKNNSYGFLLLTK